FLGSRDGLVHISELREERVPSVEDVVKVEDQVKVKVLGIDDRGKVKLSMRAVNQETGEEIPIEPRGGDSEGRNRRPRRDRDRRRAS
ncbi:MAG: S1 RNA-binding domain-containing protein, partial [Alphaproteobacteria bacterium]|nr:S1 RNA-binding domain-containing protein [Alphaproteobacteria bacterium]